MANGGAGIDLHVPANEVGTVRQLAANRVQTSRTGGVDFKPILIRLDAADCDASQSKASQEPVK